ncbi:MAG: ABC transporter permease [Pseudomonadota bacterium]
MKPLSAWVYISPWLVLMVLAGPVLAGLAGIVLPAFGWLPALGGDTPGLHAWRQLSEQPGLSRMVIISLTSGLLTTALAMAIVSLFVAGWSGTRSFRAVERVLSPLLSIPHAAAALALVFLIAPSGLLARWVSPWLSGWQQPPDLLIVNDVWGFSMMAGLVVKEVPFLFLVTLAALRQCHAGDRMRLARSLGYAPIAGWFRAVFPALYPLIRLPVYAVIAYASAAVDVGLILGPTSPPPLSVAVLGWLNDPRLDMRFMASAGALLQLLVTVGALSVWWLGERLVTGISAGWLVSGGRRCADRWWSGVGLVAVMLTVFLAAAGLLGLLIWSFAGFWSFPASWPAQWTMATWERAVLLLGDPLRNAALVGVVATLVSVVLVLGWLENGARSPLRATRLPQRALYLPLIVPAVAFLFGLVMLQSMLGIQPGLASVVVGHLVFVLPYVYLSLSESYRRMDPRWIQLARTLGASPDRAFFRVRLPMLMAPCLTAAAVGFAVSIGQYLPTVLLGAGRVTTVTTEAVALASGGDRRIVAAFALTQAVLPAVGYALALGLPALLMKRSRSTHP